MKSIFLLILAAPLFAATPTLEIKVDQVGYLNTEAKVALVSLEDPRHDVYREAVERRQNGVSRHPAGAREDFDSGDSVQVGDFSAFTKSGTYYIDVPDVGRSWDFEISPDVYAKTWRLAMRSYYGQRCGIAVDLGPEFPGYKHAACHLEGAYHPSSGKTGPHVPKGGWHDAGDYGRYVVNSGITTGTLLWTYEMYGPRLKSVKLALPESGNGSPTCSTRSNGISIGCSPCRMTTAAYGTSRPARSSATSSCRRRTS